jgi:glycosyltransferase 2 family protein
MSVLFLKIYHFSLHQIKILFSRKELFFIVSFPITLGILIWLIWKQKDFLLEYSWQLRTDLIILVFLVYVVILFLTSWVWSWMMKSFGSNEGFWRHFRAFCISALGKRLPGTVWYVVWRAQMYESDGHSPGQISLVSGIEAAVSTISAAIVGFLFALPILFHNQLGLWGLVVILILSLLLLHPSVINWFNKYLKIKNKALLRKELVIWILLYVLIRILVGSMFFMIGNIFLPIDISLLPYFIGCAALVAGLAMFLFFFPSNFGFAEVSLSLLLSSVIPSSIAVIIVVSNRILIVCFELLWAILVILIEKIRKKIT